MTEPTAHSRNGVRAALLPPPDIVGSSPGLLAAVQLARQVARTDIPVLIVGETGTGKELIAGLVHRASRREGGLVAVDCGALPDDLAESLLFGHRRGAFTGAIEHTEGLIAEADHGTLLMDELGSLSLRGQAKLLRVIETRVVRRVGESRSRVVAFRLISTAQHGLPEMVREGRFREDLMQRVAGVVIQLPSLRDRGDDVLLLSRHFANAAGMRLEAGAASLLAAREWPGNVRELKGMLTRCAVFANGNTIDVRAVAMASELGPAALGDRDEAATHGFGATRLAAVCRQHQGDPDRVARSLGIGRSTLYRRLRQAGIRLDAFRGPTLSA